jgi:hypothetical protein
MKFDPNLIAIIITALLTLLAAFGGVGVWIKKLITAIKESTDVGVALDTAIKTIDDAIADNIMEVGELETIKQKFNQVKAELETAKIAWKDLFDKHVK